MTASMASTTFFSTVAGNIDVSPDGQRMLVAVTEDKTSYEVELATGRVLTRFDNLHDLGSLKPPGEAKARMAGRFRQTGIYYAHPPSR